MNHDYKPYLDEFVIVLIDDMLIFSWTRVGINQNLRLVLELIKMYAKFYKFMCLAMKGSIFDPSKNETAFQKLK